MYSSPSINTVSNVKNQTTNEKKKKKNVPIYLFICPVCMKRFIYSYLSVIFQNSLLEIRAREVTPFSFSYDERKKKLKKMKKKSKILDYINSIVI